MTEFWVSSEGGTCQEEEEVTLPSSSRSSFATCDFFSVSEPRRLEKKLVSPESPAWRDALSAADR